MAEGKLRWQCNQCTNCSSPQTFAATSTQNAIDHLCCYDQIGPTGPIIAGSSTSQLTIQYIFGGIVPKIEFNADKFHSMLIHWIAVASIPFSVCNQPAFQTLLEYLGTCQPNLLVIA